jgi:menaquinone-dependent protoporphyrinogen oxidase
MRLLVVYGSKRGGTEGLARTLGEDLTQAGLDVTVTDAAARPDPAPYDAVVVGGALYANRWVRTARRFVKGAAPVLVGKPVWLFSSGPLDDSARERDIGPVRQVAKLMARVQARGHATFGGRLAPDAKGFPAAAMAKKNSGDWRNWDAVHDFAQSIAAALVKPAHSG